MLEPFEAFWCIGLQPFHKGSIVILVHKLLVSPLSIEPFHEEWLTLVKLDLLAGCCEQPAVAQQCGQHLVIITPNGTADVQEGICCKACLDIAVPGDTGIVPSVPGC